MFDLGSLAELTSIDEVDEAIQAAPVWQHSTLWRQLALTSRSPDVRRTAIQDARTHPSMEWASVLEALVASPTEDSVRESALEALAYLQWPIEGLLRHLISDTSESTRLRSFCLEWTAGSEQLLPLVVSTITEPEQHPEIVFWGLYAIASVREPTAELRSIVERFLEDDRVVDPKMAPFQTREATVAMEAAWVLDWLDGQDVDPEWMT